MDHERTKSPYNKKSDIPKKYNWQSLLDQEGVELEKHYIKLLNELGKESERFKCFDYEEILKRDKTNLDIFWLKDESLDDLDKLPNPKIITNELTKELESALEQLKEIKEDFN